MSSSIALRRALLILPALLLVGHSVPARQAQEEAGEYTPTVGQPGKDVVWVPTPDAVVERMLKMANVGETDYVIDLGSGDGRTVIAAAQKFGARALGIEYNPDLVELSLRNAEKAGVLNEVKFIEGDVFEADFTGATVLTMYLLPSLNLKLRPQILELRPGTRVVSHAFDMAEWEADQKITVEDSDAYLWIVPADVHGNWRVSLSGQVTRESWALRLVQDFQVVYGQVRLADERFRLLDGRIRGAEVSFLFIDASGNLRKFSGRANGGRMDGTLQSQDGTSENWSAVRDRADGSLLEIDLSY
ncbi:MAG: class I SAM-dependent methyltransferase [Vicinamibacteria bacterium]